MSFRPSIGERRRGMTLIEVVAAVVILGTILAAIMVARAKHVRQLAEARDLERVVEVADELIGRWWLSEEGPPVNGRGSASADGQIVWRTYWVSDPGVRTLGGRVLRVEVQMEGEGPGVVVDLVVPAEGAAS